MNLENELASYDSQREKILGGLYAVEGQIDKIRLYMKNIHALKHFSFGTWSSRQHVIIKVSAQGKTGSPSALCPSTSRKRLLSPGASCWKDCRGWRLGRLSKK